VSLSHKRTKLRLSHNKSESATVSQNEKKGKRKPNWDCLIEKTVRLSHKKKEHKCDYLTEKKSATVSQKKTEVRLSHKNSESATVSQKKKKKNKNKKKKKEKSANVPQKKRKSGTLSQNKKKCDCLAKKQ
jgi:hypothetical protein